MITRERKGCRCQHTKFFFYVETLCVYVCVGVCNLAAFYPSLQNIHKRKNFKEKLDTELNNTVCACCFSGFTQCQKIKEQKQKTNLLVEAKSFNLWSSARRGFLAGLKFFFNLSCTDHILQGAENKETLKNKKEATEVKKSSYISLCLARHC